MALGIFALTMLCIYIRPFSLPLWVYSICGAVACLSFGIVERGDVARVWAMVWDSTFTLIGLIVLSIVLEKLGFFEFLAQKILHFLARSSKNKAQNTTHLSIPAARFYIFIVLFGSILATLFANDGAILVLTPLIFALFSHAKNSYIKASQDFHTKDSRAKDSHIENSRAQQSFFTPLIIFLLLVGFVSDFASNTLAISNLTNIITLHFFNLDALRFSAFMALPQIFIIIVCLLFWLFVRRFLPQNLVFSSLDSAAYKANLDSAKRKGVYPLPAPLSPEKNKAPLFLFGNQGESLASPPQGRKKSAQALLPAFSRFFTSWRARKCEMAEANNMVVFCFLLILLLLTGIFIANAFALPLCLFTLACAALCIVYARIQSRGKIALLSCLKAAPFGIVSFSLGLFIVVYGLQNSLPQLRDIFGFILHEMPESSHIFSVGLLSSLGSSMINNLPMTMLGDLSLVASGFSNALGSMLDSVPHSGELFADMNEALIYAHLLGCNVGAKLTPIGSLATLLWLESLKRYGVHIGFLRYTLVAFIVVLPALCAGLLGLMIAEQLR